MSFQLQVLYSLDEQARDNDKLLASLVGRPYDDGCMTGDRSLRTREWRIGTFQEAVQLRKKLVSHGFKAHVRED